MTTPTADSTDLMAAPAIPNRAPLAFLDTALAGVQQYHAIMSALDLGLFDLLCRPQTSSECAAALGCRIDLLGLVCESLVSTGLLEKAGDQFSTGALARTYLVSDSPFYQRQAIAFQRQLAGLWADLPTILKDGPVTYDRPQIFRDLIIPSMAEHCRCGLLQQVVTRITALPEFSTAKKLLDIGGGHGLYAIALCQQNPGLEATVFDLPAVTAATGDFIEHYHAEHVHTISGDFFVDPIGSGYDIIFSSSNPGGKVPALIPKIAAALNDGGLFINKQPFDETQSDPWHNLEWNLWTFTGMQKQSRRYVFADSVPLAAYQQQLQDHGFVLRDAIPFDEGSVMIIAQKTGSTD